MATDGVTRPDARWRLLEEEARQAFGNDPHYALDMARALIAIQANKAARAARLR